MELHFLPACGRIMEYDKENNLFHVQLCFASQNEQIYYFSAVATEHSTHSSIERVITFQGFLSASTSAEFRQTFHPDTTAFGAFAEPQHSSCYRVFGSWIFCGERPLSRKKASTSRCSQSLPAWPLPLLSAPLSQTGLSCYHNESL